MEKLLKVNGMTCGHCKAAVIESLKALDGVSSVDVNLDSKEVKVEGENLDLSKLKTAIEDIGFEVE